MNPQRTTNKTGEIPEREIVQDDQGRIVGSVQAVEKFSGKRILLPRDMVPFVKEFLIQLQKEKLKEKQMSKGEIVNQVKLAGIIKSIKARPAEGGGFILVDVGADSKYIACTIHENQVLGAKLEQFHVDDFIQLVGFCRAWSQKKNNEWQNNMEVRITRIANDPPRRAESRSAQQHDDDVSF